GRQPRAPVQLQRAQHRAVYPALAQRRQLLETARIAQPGRVLAVQQPQRGRRLVRRRRGRAARQPPQRLGDGLQLLVQREELQKVLRRLRGHAVEGLKVPQHL